jgi:ABC-type polysaccharide/polyol phosphate export permease/Tfp pilus assembly protein PilF
LDQTGSPVAAGATLDAVPQGESLDGRPPTELIAMAAGLLATAQLEQAGAIALHAVALAPLDVCVLAGASFIIAQSGDHATSAKLCERALAITPDDASLRLHFAAVLLELQDIRRARQQVEAHLALAPESALGWRNLSSALCAAGEFDQALEACARAVQYEPRNIEFRIHRASVLNHIGRGADALVDLHFAEREADANPLVARIQSIVFDTVGDADAALRYAEKASRLAPDNLDYRQYHEDLKLRFGEVLESADKWRALAAERREAAAYRTERRQYELRRWLAAIRMQGRIIFALLIRETRTRFGETRLGYFWAIVEPSSHLALIAAVFSFITKGVAPIGESLIVYYFTGVLPYLLFGNTIIHVQESIESNKTLLEIPVISHVDVLIARGLLELVTQATVAVIMLSVFLCFDLPAIPDDIPKCMLALTCIWLLAFGVGVCNCVILHFIKSWDVIFATVVRSLYFTSGVFISPMQLPDWVRDILVWNPLFQGIDWFRTGFYSTYDPDWLNRPYMVVCAIGTLLIGFGAERALRRKLSVHD